MLLYHGTCSSNRYKIEAKGILPRRKSSRSNWKHTVESNPNCVYLTQAYPLYFAMRCVREGNNPMIFEIDTDLLDGENLRADEDAVEQLMRNRDDLPAHWDMRRRTKYYRDRIENYTWTGSLKALGNCSHFGPIPMSAVKQIAVIDQQKQVNLCYAAMDAVTAVVAFRFCGGIHRSLTRWIFDQEPFKEDEWLMKPIQMTEGDGSVYDLSRWPPSDTREGIKLWAP